MNEEEREKIKQVVNQHIDDLEDCLNGELRNLLRTIGILDTDLNAISEARRVFFEGNID